MALIYQQCYQQFYSLKQAWQSLKNKPNFVTTVILTIGLSLGALLCVLTLAYSMLIKPLPYPEQDKLYSVSHEYTNASGDKDAVGFSYPNLINLYNNQTVFSQTALLGYFENVITSMPSQPTFRTSYVTPEWFELLDADFVLGRGFSASEKIDSNNPVVILSYQTWFDDFKQSVDILSKKITIRGVSFSIIGVLAPTFIEPQLRGAGVKTKLWFPWDFNNDSRFKKRWTGIGVNLAFVGKLKSNFTPKQAEQSITAFVNEKWQENVADIAFFKGFTIALKLTSLKTVILGDSQQPVHLLVWAVLGLVVIAVSNLVNLYISRSVSEQGKLAIHAALGAKKSTLFKTLFLEAALLMTVASILALLLTQFGFYLLNHFLSHLLPRLDELAIGGFTYVMMITFIVLFSLFFSFANMASLNYQKLILVLQSSGKGTAIQVPKKIRQALITSQVAIAVILVFANLGLFTYSLDVINTPLGYQVNNRHFVQLSITSNETFDRKKHRATMAEFRQAVAALPQVEMISQSSSPLDIFGISAITDISSGEKYSMPLKSIDHQYFSLIEQPLLAGDFFTPDHIKNESMVVIINDIFAQKITSNTNKLSDAIGMKVELGSDGTAEIIGVVKGIKLPGETDIPMRFYDSVPSDLRTIIKLKNNQKLSHQTLVEILNKISKKYSVFRYQSLETVKNQQLFTQVAIAITSLLVTVLSLALVLLGLFGVLSYTTQMRRFEIGTRMSIGAKKSDIIKLMLKDNIRTFLLGILVSILVILVLLVFFKQTINNVFASSALELVPLYLMSLMFITAIASLSCYLPLRQFVNKPVVYSLKGGE